MHKIGKYEFDSREQAQTKIDALGTATDEDGNEYPTHKHTIAHLGHIVLEQGEYDFEGEETVAPVLSSKWHVDVLWVGLESNLLGVTQHPYGWRSASISLSTEGSHVFAGVSYLENKI